MTKKQSTSQAGQTILAQIRRIRPFLAASLTVTKKRCGNPKCRCAEEGPMHETCLLTWKEEQKTHTLSVPKELREEVTQWIEEWKALKGLVRRVSDAQREFLQTLKRNTRR